MRDIGTVFAFTLREGLRKKTVIVTTILGVIVILIACMLPSLFSGGEDQGQTAVPDPVEKIEQCYVIYDGVDIPGSFEALTTGLPHIDFQHGEKAKLDEYLAKIESSNTTYLMLITQKDARPFIDFYSMDFMTSIPTDSMAEIVRTQYATNLMADAGVDPSKATEILTAIPYHSQIVGKMDVSGYALGIALTMVMFFAVYFYGYSVATSVASEKTSRVMETLIISTRPSSILLGKVLAMGVLGLIQMGIFGIVGALGFTLLVPEGFTIMGMPLALSAFTLESGLLLLVYFLLGYALYAFLNSVCGSMVSRAEDVGTAMAPVMLLIFVSFYSSYAVMFLPDAGLKTLVTYIPLTSPFIMPYRLLNEQVPMGDIAISLGLLVAAILIVAFFSIRIYRASVLHYGERLKLRDLGKLKG